MDGVVLRDVIARANIFKTCFIYYYKYLLTCGNFSIYEKFKLQKSSKLYSE